jgi:hypothetical protein
MASEWRVSFDEFAANLPQMFERLRHSDDTLYVETDDETIALQRAESDAPRPDAMEAFRSVAGSWSDVDVDELIERIYEGRERRSDRPSVRL